MAGMVTFMNSPFFNSLLSEIVKFIFPAFSTAFAFDTFTAISSALCRVMSRYSWYGLKSSIIRLSFTISLLSISSYFILSFVLYMFEPFSI